MKQQETLKLDTEKIRDKNQPKNYINDKKNQTNKQ